MLKVSAEDFQRDVGRYQEMAQREVVTITRDGLENCVLISPEEYHRLKRRDREVLSLDDFTDADIEALEASRPPIESAAFDNEFKR